MGRLILVFLFFPLLELYVLVKVGGWIGAGLTVFLVVFTALLGAVLARHQGVQTMFRIRTSMDQGLMPAEDLLDGAMILVAGAFLLVPGFITDVLGFALLFPPLRSVLKARFRGWASTRMASREIIIEHDPLDR
jgi:UPF0716 protein FxsA